MGEEQVEKITQVSDAETEVLHGAGWSGIDFCIMESGMLYVKDGQMRYYDFAGNDSYWQEPGTGDEGCMPDTG